MMKRYRCAKCGNDVEANIEIIYDRRSDMLVVKCLRCRYNWKTKTEDNQRTHDDAAGDVG